MENRNEMKTVERNLGYAFRDPELLANALTHRSYTNGARTRGTLNNERLEFLGDAWLDALIGEELYRRFPDTPEGKLTKIRADLVCEKSLAVLARELGIGPALLLSTGEERTGGREKNSILADAVEAVVAAVYLDGGFEQVRAVVRSLFAEKLAGDPDGMRIADYKTLLQEKLQQNGPADIVYTEEDETGPAHERTFIISVSNFGEKLGTGVGRTKKEAEQNAARQALGR